MALGYRLKYCPRCHEELLDFDYDEDLKEWEKQCVDCDLLFRKKGRNRWTMKSLWDIDVY